MWSDWFTCREHIYHVPCLKPHKASFPFECPVNITTCATQHPKWRRRSITRLHIYASNCTFLWRRFQVTSVFIELGHLEGKFYFISILDLWDNNNRKFRLSWNGKTLQYNKFVVRPGGRGLGNLFTAVSNHVAGCVKSCRHLAFGSGRNDSPQPWTSFQVPCHLTIKLIL